MKYKYLYVLLLVITPIIGFTEDKSEAELIKLRIKELELKKEVLELEAKQQNKTGNTEPMQMYQTPSSQTANSRNNGLIRGPRGGCYTLTRSGNKRYVDRSLCN